MSPARAHLQPVQGLWWHNVVDLGASFVLVGLAIAVLYTVERLAARFIAKRLGWNGVLLTGWLGVPLHELSHWIVARMFGHRIVGWKLFEPDPATGTLGYVRHAYERRNLWQLSGNFFVGIAPLGAGGLALAWLLMSMLHPAPEFWRLHSAGLGTGLDLSGHGWADWAIALASNLWHATQRLAVGLWHERTVWLPLQAYVGVAIASHAAPSPRDLRESLPGLPVVLGVGVLLTGLLALFGYPCQSVGVLAPLLVLLVAVVVLFQGLYVGTVALCGMLRKRR